MATSIPSCSTSNPTCLPIANTLPHAFVGVIGVLGVLLAVGVGDAGSSACQTVIGAGARSAGVGAGGLCNINIDMALINSDMQIGRAHV